MLSVFNHFKDFAAFLLADEERLDQLAVTNSSLARENELPLLQFYSHLSEAEQTAVGREHLRAFMEQAVRGVALEEARKEVDLWKAGNLSFIPKGGLQASDLTLVYSLRKQLFLQFLPSYTREVDLFSQIALELEIFHQKLGQYAFEVFMEVQQDELIREKELSEAIINHSVDGIMAFNKEQRFVLWNKTLEQRYGRKKEEVLGKSLFEVYPTLKETEAIKAVGKALEGKSTFLGEQPNPVHDGWYEAHFVPLLNKKGEAFGAVSIVHDISEWKRQQLALERQHR